jgi:hypothetical protein
MEGGFGIIPILVGQKRTYNLQRNRAVQLLIVVEVSAFAEAEQSLIEKIDLMVSGIQNASIIWEAVRS